MKKETYMFNIDAQSEKNRKINTRPHPFIRHLRVLIQTIASDLLTLRNMQEKRASKAFLAYTFLFSLMK